MSNVRKQDRVQDTDIKRYNHVGLGLKAIADKLGCHAATVTTRLKALGIKPTDTRRSFLEQVFDKLTPDEQEWLSQNLYNADIGVKEFVVGLIKEAFANTPSVTQPALAALPELQSPRGPADVAPSDAAIFRELVSEAPVEPEVEARVEALAAASVEEIISPSVEPEYVKDALSVALCGICHESAVAKNGEVCASCGAAPAVKTESVFG